MKMIYLASPYSCTTKHKWGQAVIKKITEFLRYKKITIIAAKLHTKFNHAFILPITQSKVLCDLEPELGGSFEKWAARDLEFISRCDEVWVVKMEGWKESVGVRAEIKFAKDIKKPVKYIDLITLKVLNK